MARSVRFLILGPVAVEVDGAIGHLEGGKKFFILKSQTML